MHAWVWLAGASIRGFTIEHSSPSLANNYAVSMSESVIAIEVGVPVQCTRTFNDGRGSSIRSHLHIFTKDMTWPIISA